MTTLIEAHIEHVRHMRRTEHTWVSCADSWSSTPYCEERYLLRFSPSERLAIEQGAGPARKKHSLPAVAAPLAGSPAEARSLLDSLPLAQAAALLRLFGLPVEGV